MAIAAMRWACPTEVSSGSKPRVRGAPAERQFHPRKLTLLLCTVEVLVGQVPTHAAQQTTQMIALYSITSSARASSVGEMVMPNAFAVLTFRTSSNLVGCSIGRSAGFAPLRILST